VTGAPVADACVTALNASGTGQQQAGFVGCSNESGHLTIGPMDPGSYSLLATPPFGSDYGLRYVGTGDPAKAQVITVLPTSTTTGPTIRLDRAGTISGVVSGADTGQPVRGGVISLYAYGREGPNFYTLIDEQGHYSIDFLGPYEWPLLLDPAGYPRQWSGRYRRTPVGKDDRGTVRQDIHVQPGGTRRRTTDRDDHRPRRTSGERGVRRSQHGNRRPDANGRRARRPLRVGHPRDQNVKIMWLVFDEITGETASGWYGGTSFADATSIPLPKHGTVMLDLSLPVN
jgi:hypothetical protein